MKEKFGLPQNSGFTLRSIIWGVVIGVILQVLMYYMTMAMGFTVESSAIAAILAIAVLPIIGGKTNRFEVNLVQTIASATAIVAFPLAAFYIAAVQRGEAVSNIMLVIILLLSGVIGIAMNTVLRAHYVNDPTLPFPIAQYVSNVVKKSDSITKKEIWALVIGIVVGIILTIAQELASIIPSAFPLTTGWNIGINITLGFVPLAIALGYFMGIKTGWLILVGTLLANLVVSPIATAAGWIENPNIAGTSSLTDFNLSFFLGLAVVGTFAFLLFNAKKFNFKIKKTAEKTETDKRVSTKGALIVGAAVLVALAVILAVCYKTNILWFLVSVAVGLVVIYIYTRIQAQTGMGVQSYMTLITFMVALLLIKDPLVCIIVITIVACIGGLSGDTISDFKTGQIIGADPKAQYIAQYIGVIPGCIIAVVVMNVMIQRFGVGADTGLYPAAQIFYATSMFFSGFGETVLNVWRLLIGAGAGVALAAFGIPAAVIGMSMYLGMSTMLSAFLGSVIRYFVDKKCTEEKASIATTFFSGIAVGFGIIVTIVVIVMLVTAG